MGIDGEPELGLGLLGQPAEERVGGLDHLAALLTDEMSVRSGGQVVRRRTVPKVCVHDHSEPFQLVEIAIDGREVNIWSLFLHLCGQVLCRVVAFGVEEGPQQQTA